MQKKDYKYAHYAVWGQISIYNGQLYHNVVAKAVKTNKQWRELNSIGNYQNILNLDNNYFSTNNNK